MDEELEGGAAMATAARALDLNELQKLSSEELESLGRDFDLRLHSARPRHYHILDLIRAALGTGMTVTAEGFLDQVGDSFALEQARQLDAGRRSDHHHPVAQCFTAGFIK